VVMKDDLPTLEATLATPAPPVVAAATKAR
jgi:hypothetical protein